MHSAVRRAARIAATCTAAGTLGLAAIDAAGAAPASTDPPPAYITYFTAGGATATWIPGQNASRLAILTTATSNADIELNAIPATAPARSPTFIFTGPYQAGSPRMYIGFAGRGHLEGDAVGPPPANYGAHSGGTLDPTTGWTAWDSANNQIGSYGTSYTTALAALQATNFGGNVVKAKVVMDQEGQGAATNVIAQLQYNGQYPIWRPPSVLAAYADCGTYAKRHWAVSNFVGNRAVWFVSYVKRGGSYVRQGTKKVGFQNTVFVTTYRGNELKISYKDGYGKQKYAYAAPTKWAC